jgi:hypothetical protein
MFVLLVNVWKLPRDQGRPTKIAGDYTARKREFLWISVLDVFSVNKPYRAA